MSPDIIDIRRFNPQDFSSLLEAEAQAWKVGLRWDFEYSARVIASCLQEKRLSGYALVREGAIAGYCFFFCDGDKALIGDLFVNLRTEGRESALDLLTHVVETLQGTPGLRRIETQLPHFSYEELEPLFRAWDFQGYRRYFMAARLDSRRFSGQDLHARPSARSAAFAEAFRLVPWDRAHDREAAELLYATYQGHVDSLINDQYASIEGAHRLIENIVRQHGCGEYLPGISRVIVHQPTERLAGVLAVTNVRATTGHIPQVAIARDFQGQGLGTVLIETAFEDLVGMGYKEVSLTVTESNTGAVRLYERLGFETFRTFGAFVYNRPG